MQISVLICTYNPIDSYLLNCLNAIHLACSFKNVLEILIIDNNSTPSIESKGYVKKFINSNKNARVIVEEHQGLTPARLRGIKESKGELLIFIDDDNIINEKFFIEAAINANKHTFIGAFSGNVDLEFAVPPPNWLLKYRCLLVHTEVKNDLWTNNADSIEIMPCGAGLCIRKDVGQYYLKLHEEGKRKFTLDRNKDSLFSAGDNDLSLCACDIGYGMGLFKSLSLKHLIPPERMNKKYIKKLVYGIYFSGGVLRSMRGKKIPDRTMRSTAKLFLSTITLSSFDASIIKICEKARIDAKKWAKLNIKRIS